MNKKGKGEGMIETVLGIIQASDLGVTMCHEHLAMDLSGVRGDVDSIFENRELILSEIMKLKTLGCQSIIEVTSEDMGRKILDLQYYSEITGLHIVASTGGYLKPYHTEWMKEATVEDLTGYFLKELTIGIGNTTVKAGLIAEIATSSSCIYECEKKIFKAAGKASFFTNCAVSTHCDMANFGHEQIDLLVGEGTSVAKIILGHIDLSENLDYQRSLLDRGVNVAFDTVGKEAYLSDETRAEALVKLLTEGYQNQILLSQDVSRLSYLTKFGGLGYTTVLGRFIPMLKRYGITENQIEKMLIDNPSRILDR